MYMCTTYIYFLSFQLQNWYKTFHSMNLNSKASYKAYLDAVRDHELKEIFNMEDIALKEVSSTVYYKVVMPNVSIS